MTAIEFAAIATKIIKLVLNIIVIVLYRKGDQGYFLGASYNKNHDAEALTSGIYIGFLIYTLAALIAAIFDRKSVSQSITEIAMNFIGAILWITTGGVVLQYWQRFVPGNHFTEINPAKAGLAMGSLTVINSAVYLAETVLAYINYRNE